MQAPGQGLYRASTPAPKEADTQDFVSLPFLDTHADLDVTANTADLTSSQKNITA